MSELHTVLAGETLASIAHRFGFGDFAIIWNAPQNEKLKQQRKNPQVLLAGDVVFIPDKTPKSASVPTAARHVIVVRQTRLSVRVALQNLLAEPVANQICQVVIDGVSSEATTDAKGELEVRIAPNSKELRLVVGDEEERVLQVGTLDPVETITGQQARLANLAYFHGDVGDAANIDETGLAFRLFQADEELDVTGKPDDATLDRLLAVHGS